jgi:ATP-dependent Clp protease ATP-binding subunit ClpA
MTANELADELTKMFRGEEYDRLIHEIPDMLRQQAQEIEELRIQIANEEESYMLLNEYCLCAKESNKQLTEKIGQLKKELALQKLSDISQEIENRESAIYATGYWKGVEYKRMRELTDEEIEEVAKPYCDLQNWVVDKHEFARAILKKASEK